jgi:hypothetical protein
MHFEIDDLIVLIGDGKYIYNIPSKECPVYRVVGPYMNKKDVYVRELNAKNQFKHLITTVYFRKATETEIKTYKLKNMF